MSKKLIVIAGLTLLVASLAFAGIAAAQTPTPPVPPFDYGYGMMGAGRGYGMMGGAPGIAPGGRSHGMMGNWAGDNGPMHDAMFDALASSLGITRADLDSRIAAGETLAQIAASKGVGQADLATIFTEARTAAIEKAVADGVLTQAQADSILSRMNGLGGFGPCHNYGVQPGVLPQQGS